MFLFITFSAFYPAEEFLRIWKLMLLNQFHDILPGSCIKQVKMYFFGTLELVNVLNPGFIFSNLIVELSFNCFGTAQ